MASRQPSLLVDTNVWLDYFLPKRPGHAEALSFVSFAREHNHPLLYPAAIVKDVFYLTANALKRDIRNESGMLNEHDAATATEIAWGCVRSIREQATAVGTDESDLWKACALHSIHNDLEDNLIVAAAQRANASYLVTNDEGLIKHAPVAALTPKDALALLQAGL